MSKTLTKDELVEAIASMSVLDLSEVIKALEEKFGVSAAMPMAMAAAPVAAAAAEPVEEKTMFDVELTSAGGNKIQVIKVVREFTTLGLKEAKDLVDGAPQIVKSGVSKEEAEKMKAKFKEHGAEVAIK
jgi:large subunit ribosomal protein L7/L12